MKNLGIKLALILALIGVGVYISMPSTTTFLKRPTVTRQGLDLKGGVRLVYELDLSKTGQGDQASAITSTRDVIERRVNTTGVSEPIIQPSTAGGKQTVIVELPGLKNVDEAVAMIGKTAMLEFKEAGSDQQSWVSTNLTGKQVKKATVEFDSTTNKPQIGLEFNAEGTKLFGDITARNIGKPLAIFLDEEMLQAPTVQDKITGGKAQITGDFKIQDVKNDVNLLNAGALDVPIKLVEQRVIGASLGEESVKKSLVAGLIGLALVGLFMLLNYRFAGVVALLALIGYTAITLAIYKLVPITLTLAGIAGFILSIGMAVDANILIFERMREELLKGKTLTLAIDEGFRRAMPSIKDSNAATLITCGVLYFTTTGMTRGFALTLAIGVAVSLFSAITASHNFLRMMSLWGFFKKGLEKV